MSNLRDISLLFSGSLLVGIGGSLVGTFAVKSSLLPVFLGYILFVLGYKISWLVLHNADSFREMMTMSVEIMGDESMFRLLRNLFLISTGVLITSYGPIFFYLLFWSQPAMWSWLEP